MSDFKVFKPILQIFGRISRVIGIAGISGWILGFSVDFQDICTPDFRSS